MAAAQAGDKVIRDAAFARRLEQACDGSPHCPPFNKGRLTWIADELGKSLGQKLSVQTVSRWMDGVSKPRHAKAIKLAQLLGVDSTWLYLGVEPELAPRERKVRNAMADGAVNVVAGLIQMDGGHPAFPEEGDARAAAAHIDLYAVIKGAQYAFHVTLGIREDGGWRFAVPADHEGIVVLGVVREGLSFHLVELTGEMIEANGTPTGARTINVSLDRRAIDANGLEGFTARL